MRKFTTRRRMLQGLFSLVFLPHIAAAPKSAAQQGPGQFQDLVYTDSDGTADLSSLKDGNTTTGGIVYGA